MGLFEFIYYTGYSLKKYISLARRKKLSVPVISIGNITAGGTGKTPLAIALAEEALKRGFNPCILTRGYRGRKRGPFIVTGSSSEADAGDEPLLMARKLKEIAVVKGADRYSSGIFALNNIEPPPDLFILDDGFQHWRLGRDMDIVLIDADNPFGNGRLLPMGLLREPAREIGRADIIVITKAEGFDAADLLMQIRKHNFNAKVFVSRHSPSYVKIISSGEHYAPSWLSGQAVYAFCGIGDPDSFGMTLRNTGADIRGFKAYKDHYRYKKSDIEGVKKYALVSGAQWIITTEKDIMRLGGFELPHNIVLLCIDFDIEKEFYAEVFGRCF